MRGELEQPFAQITKLAALSGKIHTKGGTKMSPVKTPAVSETKPVNNKEKTVKSNKNNQKSPVASRKPKETEVELVARRDKELCKKYKHAVAGTLQRETSGHHANRMTMEIKCCEKGCDKKRRVATSDLFQVKLCEEHSKSKRNKKARANKAKSSTNGKPKTSKKESAKA